MRKRSALPVLAALVVGSTTAGAATVLAKPLDLPLSNERAVLSASYTNIQRPPGPVRHSSAPPATSSQTAAPPTTAPTTTAPTTTSPPASSTKPPAQPPPSSSPPPSSPDPSPSKPIERVVELVNKERATAGCNPLVVNDAVTAAAAAHSSDMSERNYFSHTTPEGVPFDQRIKDAGYGLPGAENIARGQKSADAVMNDWMKSPGHRANILNCQLKVIGVGLDTDGFYWTQDFGF